MFAVHSHPCKLQDFRKRLCTFLCVHRGHDEWSGGLSTVIYPSVFPFYTVRSQEDLWSGWRSFIQQVGALRHTSPPSFAPSLNTLLSLTTRSRCPPPLSLWNIFCTTHYSIMPFYLWMIFPPALLHHLSQKHHVAQILCPTVNSWWTKNWTENCWRQISCEKCATTTV